VVGASAERSGRRKQFMFAWTLLGVLATGALYLVGQGQWFAALLLFVLGTIGFNGGVVFNDSLLLDVAEPKDFDRVSAFGYALGYLGGGLLFLVNVIMVQKPALFGLRDATQAVQVSFVTDAVWWLLFTIPVETGLARAARRAGGEHDRIERVELAFHERVAHAFDVFASSTWQAAHPECGPIVLIDGTGSEAEVFGSAVSAVRSRWPASFPLEESTRR